MFSLSKRRILMTALGFEYSDSQRAKLWLCDKSLIPLAQSVPPAIDTYSESASSQDVEVIKRDKRRLVLRINLSQSGEESFIVKVFPLRCLRHRLKYHSMKYDRFAFGEAANLLIAARRGLNVPKVYGYGCIYGSSRLIKKDILILEDLAPRTSVGELLKLNKGDEEKCAKIFSRTIPIFVDLYKAKCNHIGSNISAIMLGDEKSKQDDFILDFEYAKFHNKPSLEVLMFEAAHFAKRCCTWVTKKTMNEWKDKLLDAVEIKDNATRNKIMGYFNYYFDTQLSRKERQKVGVS